MRSAATAVFVLALFASPAAAQEGSDPEVEPIADAATAEDEPTAEDGAIAADEAIAAEDEPAAEDEDEQAGEDAPGVYLQGQGRGFLYGAHVVSPVILGELRRAGGTERIVPSGGAGVHARLGWELPLGFSIEAYGGLAVNAVDTAGLDVRSSLMRVDFGLGGRYSIFFGSMFVPFVEVGVGLAFYMLQWPSGDENGGAMTLPLRGAVGAHLELAPYFGLELGVAFEYAFGLDAFEEGIPTITPFLGVTLFVYDPNG